MLCRISNKNKFYIETTVDIIVMINLFSLIDLKKKEKPSVFKYIKAVFISNTIPRYFHKIYILIYKNIIFILQYIKSKT